MRHPRLRRSSFKPSPIYRNLLNPLFLIFSPIIIPIRFFIIIVSLVLNFMTDSILYRLDCDISKPLSKFSMKYLKITKLITYKLVCMACSIHVVVKGKQQAKIIIGNHSSMFDIPVLIASGIMCTISKSGVTKVNLLKPGILVSRTLLARTCQGNVIDTLKERYSQQDSLWPTIGIFAAGTTVENDCIIPFRTGAFQPMQPVQLLNITYNTGKDFTYTVQNAKQVIKNILLNPFGTVTVEYLTVIKPEQGETPIDFATRTQFIMASLPGKEISPFGYKDCLYFVGKNFVPSQAYQDEFGWMGTHDDYMLLCKKVNKDPFVQWDKADLIAD
ncbi:Lysophosphatidylcholine acyltransferase/Lyso-PAF acetyltransferase [Spironucleus salmonicida]|uniref:Lysophosphatidylcholine acyltransferase/Lyso-PAF acetyltransferase n=1 Tax=Spironucleus salmonicida TaxID=348837 RepID=V6LL33_9EUKA|nr:Lysophosphatidylcholine acyltransferase/Lyso-PAF acetyltransferase [Spironucleus salmonicida]|eukprot:EST45340.1 Lysophospholipid acyltransferase (LPLAT) superfamily [Spironucleus salmonicida]